MLGMVLAAGAGRRLRPYTDTLPKALVPVDDETTILDLTLSNFSKVGLRRLSHNQISVKSGQKKTFTFWEESFKIFICREAGQA